MSNESAATIVEDHRLGHLDGAVPASQSHAEDRSGRLVPAWLDRSAALSWRVLLVAASLSLLIWLAARLRLVVLPVIVALLLATVLEPGARWLRRRRVPASAASLVMVILAVVVLGGLLGLIGAGTIAQGDDLATQLDEGLSDLGTRIERLDVGISAAEFDRAVDDLEMRARELSRAQIAPAANLAVELLSGLALTLVLTFFVLKDGARMWSSFVGRFHHDRQERVSRIGNSAWETLTGYVRGTAIIAAVDAVLIGAGLFVLDVPLVVPLTLLVFIGSFLPLIGAVVSGGIAALVALATEGPVTAMIVLAVVIVVQQLEGDLLAPFVLGRAVSLHPVAILLALTAGAVVAGVAGAFLAVPVTAVIVNVWAPLRSLLAGRHGLTEARS